MEQPALIEVAPTPTPTTVQFIESLLFIAGEPVTITQLAHALELAPDAVEAALERLAAACPERPDKALRLALRPVREPPQEPPVEGRAGAGTKATDDQPIMTR